MQRSLRSAISMSVLALALALGSLLARPALAASQAGIELRRTKYFVDENSHVWLSVHLINASGKPVTIASIAPAQSGPWAKVDQTAAPGALFRCVMPAPQGGAKAVWINSSVGMLHFELQSAR